MNQSENTPLKKPVYDYITEWGHVTFFEIQERFGTGNIMTTTQKLHDLNIALWVGLSKDAANAIQELHNDGLIEYVPCNLLTYMITGSILQLPVVRKHATKRYVQQHWIPVLIKTTGEGGL